MLIIPAIDLRGGKCVRLHQGDFSQEKVYDIDPYAVAEDFAQQGAEWLHVVDLDGARTGVINSLPILKRLVEADLKIEFGGGVRSIEIARTLLDIGIRRVVVGTKLIQEPAIAREIFETLEDQAVAGIDAKSGFAATAGWEETSQVSAVDLAKKLEREGCRRIILTDIAKDGTQLGPNLDLLKEVGAAVQIPIIQSGGIGTLQHLRDLKVMEDHRPEGVIVGRALYEKSFSLTEALSIN